MSGSLHIYGSPGENEATIEESIALMKEIKPLSTIFYILDIFPGTRLYTGFTQKANATDDVWLDRIEDPYLKERVKSLGRQALHAFLLAFRHPKTGEPMEFTAPMPADMENILEELRGKGI